MDQAMIGVVAACAVCGFFAIIIAIIVGCYCGKRIEKKKEEEKKAQTKDWVNGVSPMNASDSGYSDGPQKLGSYQPKILGKSLSQEQLIRENSKSKTETTWMESSSRHTRRVRRFSSSSDIRSEEIGGRNVSVVEVKRREDAESTAQYVYGHQSYHNGGFVVPGYMVGDHIYPEVASQRKIRQGQIVVGHYVPRDQTGVLVRGHHVTASGGQLVQGHRVTESSEVSRQQQIAQSGGSAGITVNPEAPELVQGHRSLQTFSAEAATATQQQTTVVTETVQESQSLGQLLGQDSALPRGLITPVAQYVSEDPVPSAGTVTTVLQETSLSPVVTSSVITEERTVTTSLTPSEHAAIVLEQAPVTVSNTVTSQVEEAGLVTSTVSSVVVGQSSQVEVQHQSAQDEKFKVIRRHHEDHVKLPMWMTEQGEENQVRSMTFDEEERTQVETSEGDVSNFGAVRVVNTGTVDSDGVASLVVNNMDTGPHEEYQIVDYVDPDLPERPTVRQAAAFFERNLSTSADTSTEQSSSTRLVTTTAHVTKSTRQMVDESAEGIPPASTSTPRVPATAAEQESVTTFVIGAQGRLVQEVESHRQRVTHDGSVEFLPPPPPPPPSADIRF